MIEVRGIAAEASKKGDFTLKVFQAANAAGVPIPQFAAEIAAEALENPLVLTATAVGGFVNVTLDPSAMFSTYLSSDPDGWDDYQGHVLVEFSSPNSNKPLHLGHLRNICLGDSISRILSNAGYRVRKINLVNDRGVHICKAMLMWDGEEPEEKGDQFVGQLYAAFCKLEADDPTQTERARDLLKLWEAGDEDTLQKWREMRAIVLEGHDATYARLGVDFYREEYESDSWTIGRDAVLDPKNAEYIRRDADGSVWWDTEDVTKLVVRSDGTTVYMTQDIGTVIYRASDPYKPDSILYVVGCEQDLHFRQLTSIMGALEPSVELEHVSYGMISLPEGRLKSREGRTVDVDDLLDEMLDMERKAAAASEHWKDIGDEDLEIIAQGAVKFFLLRFSPRTEFTFDPDESIRLTGDTGPYVQYMARRAKSILDSLPETDGEFADPKVWSLTEADKPLLRVLFKSLSLYAHAAAARSPAIVCSYLLELSREFSRWYEFNHVLVEDDHLRITRSALVYEVYSILEEGLSNLGILVPSKM